MLTKVCKRCEVEQPIGNFRPSKVHGDKLHPWCGLCFNAYRRERYAQSPEYRARIKQGQGEYWAKNAAGVTAKWRASYDANPEPAKARARAWRADNKAVVKHINRQTKARRKNVPGSYTRDEWEAMLDTFGRVCLCCGATDSITVDHVIPTKLGGTNYIENLQPLCFHCNASKQDRHATDYRDPALLQSFLVARGVLSIR